MARYFVLAAVLALSGCGKAGPDRVEVFGNVTFDDQPLERGTIQFVPQGGANGPKAAGKIVAGKYRIPAAIGPVVGPLKVRIYDDPVGSEALDDPGEARRHGGRLLPRGAIPARFNQASTLSVEARLDGENQFNFDLTSQ